MKKILTIYIIIIPSHSNAMSERIFNLMKTAVRSSQNTRNRLLLKKLEAELIVKTNFEEFRKFLVTSTLRWIKYVSIEKKRSSEKY